jgi:hypothetical protein
MNTGGVVSPCSIQWEDPAFWNLNSNNNNSDINEDVADMNSCGDGGDNGKDDNVDKSAKVVDDESACLKHTFQFDDLFDDGNFGGGNNWSGGGDGDEGSRFTGKSKRRTSTKKKTTTRRRAKREKIARWTRLREERQMVDWLWSGGTTRTERSRAAESISSEGGKTHKNSKGGKDNGGGGGGGGGGGEYTLRYDKHDDPSSLASVVCSGLGLGLETCAKATAAVHELLKKKKEEAEKKEKEENVKTMVVCPAAFARRRILEKAQNNPGKNPMFSFPLSRTHSCALPAFETQPPLPPPPLQPPSLSSSSSSSKSNSDGFPPRGAHWSARPVGTCRYQNLYHLEGRFVYVFGDDQRRNGRGLDNGRDDPRDYLIVPPGPRLPFTRQSAYSIGLLRFDAIETAVEGSVYVNIKVGEASEASRGGGDSGSGEVDSDGEGDSTTEEEGGVFGYGNDDDDNEDDDGDDGDQNQEEDNGVDNKEGGFEKETVEDDDGDESFPIVAMHESVFASVMALRVSGSGKRVVTTAAESKMFNNPAQHSTSSSLSSSSISSLLQTEKEQRERRRVERSEEGTVELEIENGTEEAKEDQKEVVKVEEKEEEGVLVVLPVKRLHVLNHGHVLEDSVAALHWAAHLVIITMRKLRETENKRGRGDEGKMSSKKKAFCMFFFSEKMTI